MTLITPDELARGALLVVFGGAAGACTLAWPGSPLWLLPAAVGVAGGAFTVPEVREEVVKALPAVSYEVRGMLEDVRGARRPALAPLPQRRPRAEAPGRPMAQAPAPTPRPQRQGPRLLTPEEFAADPLFQTLDADPHRFIVGHTQGGKSSAMHAMARTWAARGEPVIVCDPDAARGQWPGCEVAGYAEDYRGIGQALDRVRDEFDARSDLYADGQRDFAPLHLVIDEVHEVFANVPGSRDFVFDTLGRRGAKRGIRVTIGTQDNARDTLGLDSAAVLDNFITAELAKDERGRRVATVYRGNAAKRKYTRQYAVPPLPGAKSFITPKDAPKARPVAAETPREAVVSVRVPERPATTPDALLASLMAVLPADVAAQVPSISPERAARLARILQNAVSPLPDAEIRPDDSRIITEADTGNTSRIHVDTAPGGRVTVNVQQVAAGGRRSPRGGRGLDMKARRQRTSRYVQVRSMAANGARFEDVYRAVKGNRNEVHAEFKRAKAELGR